jgi:hypothetical protein
MGKCANCGPGGEGNCLGPDLCCGHSFGCFFKTKETAICTLMATTSICNLQWWKEQGQTTTCILDEDTEGTCAADKLCCSTGTFPKLLLSVRR